MHDCLIAFGSNQGSSEELLVKTLELLQTESIQVKASSQPHITQPVGGPPDQKDYLNAAIRVQTDLGPIQLHHVLIQIEETLGRVREQRWGARKVDLDLILFADRVIETKNLTVPHPRMSFRRFVLEPAMEIASEMIHPISRCSIDQLLEILERTDRKILIAFQNEAEQPIAEAIKVHVSSRSTWQIEITDDANQIREQESTLTLVARFFSDDSASDPQGSDSMQIYQAAKTFPGPTLELPLLFEGALEEILAAIDGMQKR